MSMDALQVFAFAFLEIGALVFAFALGLLFLVVVYMYIADVTQTEQTLRRNYPVVGRFRYFFEHMGEFFRQYFFALDREELRRVYATIGELEPELYETISFRPRQSLHWAPIGLVMFFYLVYHSLGAWRTWRSARAVHAN